MNHWAAQYIGIPWAFGGRGPDAFDCWGFVAHVQREHFGITMPFVDVPDAAHWREAAHLLEEHDERKNWEQVAIPQEGDCVLMARARLPVHIGVWIAANGTHGVLHCLQGHGVLYQPAKALAGAGWGGLRYYRHAPTAQH